MPSADKFEWPQNNPLFEVQWRSITESLAGNGILNNGDFEVTTTSTDLEIEIAAGDLYYVGNTYSLASSETHQLSGGLPNEDRWDTVYFDTATQSTDVRQGTGSQYPEPPDVESDEHLLAIVYVPQGATDVGDEYVLNWRATILNNASDIRYSDSTGKYNVSNVEAALDELQEAAQIQGYPIPQNDLEGPPSQLQNYPLSLEVDTDSDLGNTNLTAINGSVVAFDVNAEHVPRPQVDDHRATQVVNAQNFSTSDEEHVLVDTQAIGASSKIILSTADAEAGNTIAVVDFTGSAENNPINITTEGNETIDGKSTKNIDSNYFGFILTSDGNDWTTISTVFDGVGIEDGGTEIMPASASLNFSQGLTVSDDGDNTVTVEADITSRVNYAVGTFTHTGGSSTTYRVQGVTTDETKNLNVEVGVDSDPSFSADYQWDYTWGYAWDETNGEMDIVIQANWDVDPGAGSDVALDYEIYELDGSKPSGVVIEDDGAEVVVPSKAIDFGSGLDVTDEGDGTVRVDTAGGIEIVKLTTSSSGTNINQTVLFPWDNAPLIDAPFSYTGGNDYVTVDEDGTYEIHFTCGFDTNGQDRDNPMAFLYKNRTSNNSGGTQLRASGKSGYVRENQGHDQSSLHLSWIGELTAGDTISIQMRQDANNGTRNPYPSETNMFLKKLPRP